METLKRLYVFKLNAKFIFEIHKGCSFRVEVNFFFNDFLLNLSFCASKFSLGFLFWCFLSFGDF